MCAMMLFENDRAVKGTDVPDPTPGLQEVVVGVESCGVWRSDRDVLDRALPVPKLPLICGYGLIGYRCLVKAGDARRLGIYGFGAAAHLIAQVAVFQGREVYAFTRRGDVEAQQFALSLGAKWAGNSGQQPPAQLDAAIIFAPL